jgi:hypothetical protein
MTTLHRLIFPLLAALALAGCSFNEFTNRAPAEPAQSIRNSKLYAYNFLDIRDTELDPALLAEIEKQLVKKLAANGVALKVLRFKDSEVGRSFSNGGSMTVPIQPTILGNLSEEKAFAADHRLIIFPSSIRLEGPTRFYTIRWEIVEVKSGKIIWTGTSEGRRVTLWGMDEKPVVRAEIIVDSLINEMKNKKLL